MRPTAVENDQWSRDLLEVDKVAGFEFPGLLKEVKYEQSAYSIYGSLYGIILAVPSGH